jgi:hypothetical protein
MRPRITFANVVSVIALFVALSGTAIATHPGGENTISTADIMNGEVKTGDIGDGEVRNPDLGADSVASGKIDDRQVKNADLSIGASSSNTIADGGVRGIDVANDSLTGANIDEATLDVGARAYARMDSFTCSPSATECPIADSNGVSSITRIGTGAYCVVAPGIDGNEVSAAVTTDWFGTQGPEGSALAMSNGVAGCGDGTGFRVQTERQPVTGATTVGPAVPANDVGFTIVIP